MSFTIEQQRAVKVSEPVTIQPKSGFISAISPSNGKRVLSETTEIILEQITCVEAPDMNPENSLTMNCEFRIMNSKRQPILHYVEESDFFLRALWGRLRPLHIRVDDLSGETIFYAYRKNNCCRCGCLFKCCHEAMLVEMDDEYVGQIQHRRRLFKPIYTIVDNHGATIYTIIGVRAPACRTCCRPRDVNFQVKRAGANVGEIKKRRTFFLPDVHNDQPTIKIIFPTEATVIEKTLLICAAFYIEVHYWDHDPLNLME